MKTKAARTVKVSEEAVSILERLAVKFPHLSQKALVEVALDTLESKVKDGQPVVIYAKKE